MDNSRSAIAPVVMDKPVFSILLKPVATNDQILEAWRNYQDLKIRLLDKDDFCEVSGQLFPRKSAYRKLALAFGVSVEIIKEERTEIGANLAYEVTAKATSPNGRFMVALASCHSNEKKFSKLSDIRAIANTRASNRAISDLLGGVLGTSAEEVLSVQEESQDEPSFMLKTKPAENNCSQVFTDLFKNHRQDEVEPEALASDKQKGLINHLVDQKITDEAEEQYYLDNLDNISKSEASSMIKKLLNIQ